MTRDRHRDDREPPSGTAADRKRTPADWRLWALLLCIGAIVFAGLASCDARQAANDVQRLEIRNQTSNRATAFRLCTRNKVDRAYAHARERGLAIEGRAAQGDLPAVPDLPAANMSRRERQLRLATSRALMDTTRLPVLDCEPNRRGTGAKPLPITLDELRRNPETRDCTSPVPVGRCATQEAFVQAWAMNALTHEQLGICPRSRIGQAADPRFC